ncbi:Secreted protein [Pseudomonas jessenii]
MVGLFFALHSVGASLLAMDVNDDASILDKRGVFESIASKLAPTGGITRYEWSVKPWICAVCGACWD